jgi:WD40 repeat protein
VIKRAPFYKAPYQPLALLAICVLLSGGAAQHAQTRSSQERVVTGLTDIVYSAQFSPDDRTLAIARGTTEVSRVELWDIATATLRHTIGGFDGPVWSVSFAPDGKSLVTASVEFHARAMQKRGAQLEGRVTPELKWWDSQTGELQREVTLPGDTQASLMALHSPDGQLLATMESRWVFASYKTGLKLLDARTGELRVKLKQDLNAFELPSIQSSFGQIHPFDRSLVLMNIRRQRAAFSRDGHLLAFWNSNEVRLWNTVTGEEVLKLKDFKNNLSAVAFAPVGATLAVATATFSSRKHDSTFSSEIRLYNPDTGAITRTLAARTAAISCLTFGPSGKQIIVGGWQNGGDQPVATLELLDIFTGSRGGVRTGDNSRVNTVGLSSDGEHLTFQTDLSSVKLVDTRTWTITHTFDENSDGGASPKSLSRMLLSVKRVLSLAFSADGKTIAGEIEQDGIKQWDPRTGEVKKQIDEHEDPAALVEVSANGNQAAEITGDKTVRLWDVATGAKTIIPAAGAPISAIALSSNGHALAIAYPKQIVILNPDTREPMRTLQGGLSNIDCVNISVDGEMLAAADGSGAIEIWDLASGRIKRTLTSAGKVTALRFTPDGRMLASASQDGGVRLWELQTGGLSLQLKKHSAAVNAIAFSRDGTLMATGSDDRTVIMWDTASGKSRRTLKGQDMTVSSLAFSADATLLASGGGNASVILWDVRTGNLNRVLR